MLNYNAIKSILQHRNYIDKTQYFEKFCDRAYNWETVTGCKGTGSSLFLKTLACFLDKRIDSKEIFRNLNVGKLEIFETEVNSYRVIYLDFSDCKVESYEEMLKYFGEKLSEIYKEYHLDFQESRWHSLSDIEQETNIIAKSASEKDIKHSLQHLSNSFHEYERPNKDNKLAILIDNLIQVEYCAAKFGFKRQFNDFLDKFRLEDVYKRTDVFVHFGDFPNINDWDYWRFKENIVDYTYHYWGGHYTDLMEENPHRDDLKGFSVNIDDRYNFEYQPLVPFPELDWDKYISEKREYIADEHEKQRIAHLEAVKKEKEKYAVELSPDIPRFSEFLGIRNISLDKTSPEYQALNEKLKTIYREFVPKFDDYNIYYSLQGIDNDSKTLYDREHIELLEDLVDRNDPNSEWKGISVSDHGHWIQCSFNKKESKTYIASNTNIKAYVTMDTLDIQDIFENSLKYLFKHAQNSFAAKVASCNRADQMCYWLNKEDFVHLQDYYSPMSDKMKKGPWFVAYYKNFGISRDFPDVDSHNGTIANIIADYFKTVENEDEIQLEAMFNNYIKKWNNDIYQEDSYSRFKNYTAMSFVIIMETLDIILGNKQFDESSILLNDDPKIWSALAKSHCWADLNKEYLKKL